MVFSGVSAPDSSPSRIIHSAGRSFTEPPGLCHSALPRMVTPGTSRPIFGSSSNGVLPTLSTTLEPTLLLTRVIMSGLLYRLAVGRPASRDAWPPETLIAGRPEIGPPAMVGAMGSLYRRSIPPRYRKID